MEKDDQHVDVVRAVSGMAVRTLGNILVNRIANAISGNGGSYKMTGGKRKPRKTLGCGKRKPRKTRGCGKRVIHRKRHLVLI